MAKPTDAVPVWATNPTWAGGPQAGQANKIPALAGKELEGWHPGEPPPAAWWNEHFYRVGIWAGWAAASASNFVADDHIVQTDADGIACAYRLWAKSEETTVRAENTDITSSAISASVPSGSPAAAIYSEGGAGAAVLGQAMGASGVGVKGTAGTGGSAVGVLGDAEDNGGFGVRGRGYGANRAGGEFFGFDGAYGAKGTGNGASEGLYGVGGSSGTGVLGLGGSTLGVGSTIGVHGASPLIGTSAARGIFAEGQHDAIAFEASSPKNHAIFSIGQDTATASIVYIEGDLSSTPAIEVSSEAGIGISASCGGAADLMNIVHSGTAGDGIDLLHSAAAGNAFVVNKAGGAGYAIKANSTGTTAAVYIKHDGGNTTAKEGLAIDSVGSPVAAPLRLLSVTNDPTTPNRGGVWFKDTEQCLKLRHAGGTHVLWGSKGGLIFESGSFSGSENLDATYESLISVALTGAKAPYYAGVRVLITASVLIEANPGNKNILRMRMVDVTGGVDLEEWQHSTPEVAALALDRHTLTAQWVYEIPLAGDRTFELHVKSGGFVVSVLTAKQALLTISGAYP